MNALSPRPDGIGISALERDTGLAKETLRGWERRYGFPLPARDGNGERVYPPEQVRKLRLVKRLLDQGMRPGKLLKASAEELDALVAGCGTGPAGDADEAGRGLPLAQLLESARLGHENELRRLLRLALARQGLPAFVAGTVAPLTRMIGEAWRRGELGVADEHLYTEQIQNVLRAAIANLPQPDPAPRPRVLLTTVPGEQHGLGLLMAEAMLTPHGATCVSLGLQTPLELIRAAAIAGGGFDIVALSFSAAHPLRAAGTSLEALRAALPGRVGIWAGGSLLGALKRRPAGVRVFSDVAEIPAAVAEWKAADRP